MAVLYYSLERKFRKRKIVFNYLNFLAVFLCYTHTVSLSTRYIFIYIFCFQKFVSSVYLQYVYFRYVCMESTNCLKWQLFTLSIGSDHKKCEDCGISTKLNL
jgi:hypothetical protein